MVCAYIGLGSNLGDPELQVKKAVDAINRIPGTRITRLSSLYRSRPVGPQDQPDYINAVACISTGLSADALLVQLQNIENLQGRIRKVRWGARTLDLDLLLYDDEVIDEKHLVVPHPEMLNRAFVLYPLCEIAPDIEIPGAGSLGKLIGKVNADGLQKME